MIDLVELLKGTWESERTGWNLIALPVSADKKFRLLMNQYSEVLRFDAEPDTGVPNRGVRPDLVSGGMHQLVNAIAYDQKIKQLASKDFPPTPLAAENGKVIHHEPGFFLQLMNHISIGHTEEDSKENGQDEYLQIARLATIPHGNSVLAMGAVKVIAGEPSIPEEDAFPERIKKENNCEYLMPYEYFETSPFKGNVEDAGFRGLFPSDANDILRHENLGGSVKETTILQFDTKFRNEQLKANPISNIPFVVREADTTEVHATFWIMELHKKDEGAPTEFVMQYSQTVYLEFFKSDEPGKLIRWPHVSINTLRKKI